MANFNDAAVMEVFDNVVSLALASGRFEHVNQHEPKNAPGNGLECSVWMNNIVPIRPSGGSRPGRPRRGCPTRRWRW